MKCICPDCRPKGMSLREAKRILMHQRAIEIHGVEEVKRRKEAQRARLMALKGKL